MAFHSSEVMRLSSDDFILKILNIVPTKIVKVAAGDPGDQLLLVQ